MRKYLSSQQGLVFLSLCIVVAISADFAWGQDNDGSNKQTVEPVFRVPKIGPDSKQTDDSQVDGSKPVSPLNFESDTNQLEGNSTAEPVARVANARAIAANSIAPSIEKKSTSINPVVDLAQVDVNSHPLDRAIQIAKDGLRTMQSEIHDYTAILVKRERVGNTLSEPAFMKIKIRNPRTFEDRTVPFSVYMKFVKPRGAAGREVIWVQGRNDNNLIAHEPTPLVRFKNFHLDPAGFMAMKGNKYPIYDAGLENLVIKLIEKAERDRAAGLCEVRYSEGAQINKRSCTLIEVEHKENCAPYEFHLAKVYIDDEMNIPVRFVAYDWPAPGGSPSLIEEYTYINVQLNVGLTDRDFDIANVAYDFAK